LLTAFCFFCFLSAICPPFPAHRSAVIRITGRKETATTLLRNLSPDTPSEVPERLLLPYVAEAAGMARRR
jgi:hypothetical protein